MIRLADAWLYLLLFLLGALAAPWLVVNVIGLEYVAVCLLVAVGALGVSVVVAVGLEK